jgi:regulatory protein
MGAPFVSIFKFLGMQIYKLCACFPSFIFENTLSSDIEKNHENSPIFLKIIIFVFLYHLQKNLFIMKKTYTTDELFLKAASYCSISEHCVSEVEEKLSHWNVSENEKRKIIDRLIKENFINEKRYAQSFVRDKFRLNKWGKIKIELALKSKGISNDEIKFAISTIDDGEYQEMLASALKSKLSMLKYDYEYEKQGKLFRFAQSRGFETSIIDRVLRSLNQSAKE